MAAERARSIISRAEGNMDQLQRSIYTDRFRVKFFSLRGEAFQTWFVSMAGHAYGPDFEEVRAYGPKGDLKCDGRRISTKTIYQCYAPYSMKESDTVSKVDADFHGAAAHWGPAMSEWVFVHNDDRGLPPGVVRHLDGLRTNNGRLKIETWSEPELLNLAMGLQLTSLQALFGSAPSIAIIDRLVMADLVPIIEMLERMEPDANDPPLTPPSVQKLEKNALSTESALLLRMGRRKTSLVESFFRKSPRPDLGERIAEAFRARYAELKLMDLPADTIFRHLQDYAGMSGGDPKRQGAALAILSYFFESCDIFEDPQSVATESA
jgi:hypothetical protein